MEFTLRRGDCTAGIDTLGGELISYRDREGLEYIWSGDSAYWAGRNPLLFPIIGGLREGKLLVGGKESAMARHGFARRREFTLTARGEDWAELTLLADGETLAVYPCPFSLTVRQQLTDTGFSTAVTVANTGSAPMPFCLGAHTAFRCPLEEGEVFSDYAIRFPRRETCPTLIPRPEGIDLTAPLPCLEDADELPLHYRWFDTLDTLIFRGLRSDSVCLQSRKTGRGVRVTFTGFPVLALWTMPGKAAPFLCIEPWHGMSPVQGEGPSLEDRAYAICLEPGEIRTLRYQVDILPPSAGGTAQG